MPLAAVVDVAADVWLRELELFEEALSTCAEEEEEEPFELQHLELQLFLPEEPDPEVSAW